MLEIAFVHVITNSCNADKLTLERLMFYLSDRGPAAARQLVPLLQEHRPRLVERYEQVIADAEQEPKAT